jgi:ribosome-associated translation inhibitor RaiA
MANDVAAVDVHLSTRGPVSDQHRVQAREKVARLARLCREPVRVAQVRLVVEAGPGRDRPAEVEAVLDIDGAVARAHVAAATIPEAIDLVVDRLRRRIERIEDRRHRLPDRRAATNGSRARHAEAPAQRPQVRARPVDEREVVRRKSFALEPLSIDEAAFDLDALAHDFYLFRERSTMRDCVLTYGRDGLELLHPDDVVPDLTSVATPVRLRAVSATMSEAQARERLEVGHEPFVFFVTPSGRAHVLYLRNDGHYGLIEGAVL